MAELLSTVCDHCSASLKLKNPDLEGKCIKCPKCSEAFVVVATASKPRKPVRKKSAVDDDDLDFVDDDDDYGAPDDDDELEERDRQRRSRPAKGGKKKKKKSRGGGAGQIFAIVAIVLVAIAGLGGGGYGLIVLSRNLGSSDVDWLPTDVQGYVKIRVGEVWQSGVAQPIKNGPAAVKIVQDMTKSMGMGPEDLDQMIVTLANNKDEEVVVMRSKRPFDVKTLQASEPGMQQATHGAASYLKNGKFVLYLPDTKTLILATESTIQTLISRGRKNPSATKFAFAGNLRDHLVMAALNPDPSSPGSAPRRSSSIMAGLPIQNPQTMLIRANASSDIRISVQAGYPSADVAKTALDRSQADLTNGKSGIATQKMQIQNMRANPIVKPEQLLKMVNGMEQVLNSIQLSQSGTYMNAQLSISGQLINDLMEMAGSVPTGPPPFLRQFSSPFRR